MTSEQFTYWLQGFDEIRQTKNPPTKKEWKIIQDHLKLVFTKVTPDRSIDPLEEMDMARFPRGPRASGMIC